MVMLAADVISLQLAGLWEIVPLREIDII